MGKVEIGIPENEGVKWVQLEEFCREAKQSESDNSTSPSNKKYQSLIAYYKQQLDLYYAICLVHLHSLFF